MAMNQLGNGLGMAGHNEDALSVKEAELLMLRRVGDSERNILIVQGNLAITYRAVGRHEEALRMRRDVYSGTLKLKGEQDADTLKEANNYAASLTELRRTEEAKALLRKTLPVARRVLGNNSESTIRISVLYATALYEDPCATLDDLREAVAMVEHTARIGRRVFGGAHPLTGVLEYALRESRAALSSRETPSSLPPGSA